MATEKRLIDASEVIRQLELDKELFLDGWGGFSSLPPKDKARVDELDNCISRLFNAPTVDAVEVVHGQWDKYTDEKFNGYDSEGRIRYRKVHTYYCNKCGHGSAVRSNYCPNCGAKMDGDWNA